MDDSAFTTWARAFRAEAAADDYRVAVSGWQNGVLTIEGETDPIQKWRARELVRDTVELVAIILAYYRMDGRDDAGTFLRLQTYDPALSSGSYLLLFEQGRFRRARIVVEDLDQVDLADLYEAVKFDILVLYHCDGSEFTAGEHEHLRQAILDDVRWDLSEEELCVDLHDFPTGLHVEFTEPW